MYTKEELGRAKKRVKEKKAFYQHLMAYAIVNLFLMVLNLVIYPGYFWFVFPVMGWGIGLAFHYVDVFGIPGFDILSKEWEERELERELRQYEKDNPKKTIIEPADKMIDNALNLKKLRKNYDESDFV